MLCTVSLYNGWNLQCPSYIFRFENKFGVNHTIPAAVATRWNSQYHQLRSLLRMEGMDCKALAEVCDTQEFSHALLTRNEWGQITELCKILEPFAEATNLTQGKFSGTTLP